MNSLKDRISCIATELTTTQEKAYRTEVSKLSDFNTGYVRGVSETEKKICDALDELNPKYNDCDTIFLDKLTELMKSKEKYCIIPDIVVQESIIPRIKSIRQFLSSIKSHATSSDMKSMNNNIDSFLITLDIYTTTIGNFF